MGDGDWGGTYVKPANMFMLRSWPRTSDNMTVSPLAFGSDVEGDSVLSGIGGIAGPKLFSSGCCFGFDAATVSDAVRRE